MTNTKLKAKAAIFPAEADVAEMAAAAATETDTAITTIMVNDPAAKFTARLNACLGKNVETTFEMGKIITEAKDELEYGKFGDWERAQKIGEKKSRMLRAIWEDKRLQEPEILPVLPPGWTTLFELTKLDDETLSGLVADGVIKPAMTGADVAEAVEARRSRVVNKQVEDLAENLRHQAPDEQTRIQTKLMRALNPRRNEQMRAVLGMMHELGISVSEIEVVDEADEAEAA
jgi:hypothetical protein